MHQVLVTGCAGFIGFHLTAALLKQGHRVTGVDNLNDYYDVQLKCDRLRQLEGLTGFTFEKVDLADRAAVESLFARGEFDVVVHLAAQAGVRYSLENPHAYTTNNVSAFLHVLEGCRAHPVKHLLFASSSSVYGDSNKTPFSVDDRTDKPVSLYAATKLANEHMAYAYSNLFKLPTTGLRFFTVYGPWGRPDMAYFKFTKAILEDRPLEMYAGGQLLRDFTYVDDVIEALCRLLPLIPAPIGGVPHCLHNIGNHQPVRVSAFLETLERVLGKKARVVDLPMQAGDVSATFADVTSLSEATGFAPSTTLESGLRRFAEWYCSYHK